MLYIRLLPLLLLLVSCLYIKGDDSNGAKVNTGDDRNKDLWLREDKLTAMISKEINSKVADALANLNIGLKSKKRYDELNATVSNLTGKVQKLTDDVKNQEKIIVNQQEKLDEAVALVNTVQSCAITKRPATCAEINGGKANGVYCIYPNKTFPVSVTCTNGGWTMMQRRFNGSVDFYRKWKDYARGFGNSDGEYWLGLNNIHALTKRQSMQLFVIMQSIKFGTRLAMYLNFSVSSEKEKFKLHVGGYGGNFADGLWYHNNQPFSTPDQDNDASSSKSCSTSHHGAWWYRSCYTSNLNGRYSKADANKKSIMSWGDTGWQMGLQTSIMMIRPSNFKP